jgi:cyclin C
MKGALASNVDNPKARTRILIISGIVFCTFRSPTLLFLDHGGFDYDTSKVAEFEFYLLEELEFYLIVYHPYRDLTLIAKDLRLEESNLQTAW